MVRIRRLEAAHRHDRRDIEWERTSPSGAREIPLTEGPGQRSTHAGLQWVCIYIYIYIYVL